MWTAERHVPRHPAACRAHVINKAKSVVFQHRLSLAALKNTGKRRRFFSCAGRRRGGGHTIEEEKKEKTGALFKVGIATNTRLTPARLINMENINMRVESQSSRCEGTDRRFHHATAFLTGITTMFPNRRVHY